MTKEKTEAAEERIEEGSCQHAAPDGGWGWVISIGVSLVMGLILMNPIVFGLLYSHLLMDVAVSHSLASWIFGLNQFLWDSGFLLAGPLVDVYGYRMTGLTSGLVLGVSKILAGFINDPNLLFFLFSFLGGTTCGILMCLCNMIVSQYFDKKRGRAIAIMNSGVSAGTFIGPVLVRFLQNTYGFRGSIFIFGATLLNVCVGSAVFRPIELRRENSQKTISENGSNMYDTVLIEESCEKEKTEGFVEVQVSTGCEKSVSLHNSKKKRKKTTKKNRAFTIFSQLKEIMKISVTYLKLLKSARACVIFFELVCPMQCYMYGSMCVPFLFKDKGLSADEASYALVLIGIFSALARVVITPLTDFLSISSKWYYMTGLFFISASLMAVSFMDSARWIYSMMSIFGFGVGCTLSLTSIVIIEFMGLDLLAATFGCQGLLCAVISVIFSLVIGALNDSTGSWDFSIRFLSLFSLFGLCLWSLLPLAKKFDQRKEDAARGK